jgi:hypothetical protein
MVVTEELYRTIRKQWPGKVYQDEWELPRLKRFRKLCKPLLRGARVFEIGTNAGLFGLEMSDLAESYIGLERDPHYFLQLMITVKYYVRAPRRLLNCNLLALDLAEMFGLMDPPDTFVGLFVLYHMNNREVELFRDAILPKMQRVIIDIRTQKTDTHNDYGFRDYRNALKFIQDAGFDCEIHESNHKKFHTILGRRK